jgi:hypothetical protein
VAPSQPARSTSRYTNRSTALPASSTTTAPATSAASINKSAPSFVRLSPSEIAQRRKDNKCFKCDELFTSGHREHRKQLFIIEVVDEETEGLSPDDGELTISIHALTDIQPHASRTMAILVSVNDAHLITLLDLGSTHNFIDNTTTSRAGVTLARLSGMCIAVANGDKLVSSGCCHHMAMMVHGEQFHIDCYGLSPHGDDGARRTVPHRLLRPTVRLLRHGLRCPMVRVAWADPLGLQARHSGVCSQRPPCPVDNSGVGLYSTSAPSLCWPPKAISWRNCS